MLFKSQSTGKIYPNIQKAVHDFKPQGRCSKTCPLYDTVQIRDDNGYLIPVHKCHVKYITEHETEIAGLLNLTTIPPDDMSVSKPYQYKVVIKIDGEPDQEIPCNSLNGAMTIINQRMFSFMLVNRDSMILEDTTHVGKLSNPVCTKHKTFKPDIEIYITNK